MIDISRSIPLSAEALFVKIGDVAKILRKMRDAPVLFGENLTTETSQAKVPCASHIKARGQSSWDRQLHLRVTQRMTLQKEARALT